ncbi:type IV pilus biogenesis protein PilP [Noviherbaspirillum saxi]|uniref:Type IV pilus biogenesis protein PilP n=1 Tax=Noviherbaspirillum saxi TaxID=2320863 RepID=A0A3A3G231_9BURK|nr:type IV pilus biogenesis protein PilP [Noviherbaspirillum saxi]RJF92123.1 type IV pilus biogenesis protein PilP [Noviherbaspirillum saxi]
MRNSLKPIVFLSCALLSAAAPAENTADDLMQLEAATTILKARARKIEVQAQIASKQAEIDRLAGVAYGGHPTVRAIEGIGATMYSTLQLDNGSTIDVKQGDVLPNGLKVVAINRNGVTVQGKGSKSFRLASSAPVQRQAHSAAAMPAMPTLSLPPVTTGAAR